ncbi:HAMP domain-containing protein [Fodinicola acaciae]|uniref:HAMP domain-containing protein n=1 Tax=Fodinicola acaciae TaxID=2681555 RepID=UPI001FE6DA87|nr:HAMP domain-containing protein [Fodinicola acaciae]
MTDIDTGPKTAARRLPVDAPEPALNDLRLQQLLAGLTAVRDGDFRTRLPLVGDELTDEIAAVFNGMVDQLDLFTSEVTRVSREVGTDGQLGGQADVPGVSGTWKDLTDSVNAMAGSLTGQVRDIAQVATAVARGDLSQKITVDARGEILELKNTLNTMVDQLSVFADEVTRVSREVGTEGQLGGQAQVPGVGGTWRALTDSVNLMALNLTDQVRSISQVATAVVQGDLSRKITVDSRGEILELKNAINTMVDQLSAFADEVTRVAREVGTDGRLGGQAQVPGVGGTWRALTDSVNVMAANLTDQVRSIAQVTNAIAKGDLSQKMRVDARGEVLELKETMNTMVDQLSAFADEVSRVAREVGTDGILGGQARVPNVSGAWKDLTENVNVMASRLTTQVRSIAQVATSVERGDLSKKIVVDAKGEVAALAQTINAMVDTLGAFADEVTRVAREVGTEGMLGGQARVPNVAGTWKDLTENVNSMADNLTRQVRNIADVTTAVAQGDLTRKIDVDARGEILELKTTVNTMIDTLSAFATEVTRVAREVGSEGRLGGQAEVEGASGTWKRVTENVNELADSLTRQVRSIAEVTSAVATGDLTRTISVEAQGELAELKDNINQMVQSLRDTTRANVEQDWLKTNLAHINGLMQGQRDLRTVAGLILDDLVPLVGAQYGTFFLAIADEERTQLELIGSYGHDDTARLSRVDLGQSLVGQAARTGKPILVDKTPPDYLKISSSLGEAAPATLIVLPIVFEGRTLGVVELAAFDPFTQVHRDFLQQLTETIGVTVNTIIAASRTDDLLDESQRLAAELRAQQEELQHSNAELADRAALMARQNHDIEIKNIEIEHARREIEERAQQLALASKYKSEFLANMSHELRTPLNSLLILARLLSQNPNGNLTPKQVEYATVIHSAGSDLLQLINDILDLSKVEAGKMAVHAEAFPMQDLLEYVQTTFRPLTLEKGLEFAITAEPGVPARLVTDDQRLRQVLRNLLSNAVKFTESGRVELRVRRADAAELPAAAERPHVVFSVIDTGVGIAEENLVSIFDAFQQADGTTSRRYGGTGLGLNISRQIAGLLGGEIRAESELGKGSTFSLYLPVEVGWAQPAGVTGVEYLGSILDVQDALRRPMVLVLEEDDNRLLSVLAHSAVTNARRDADATVTTLNESQAAIEALRSGSYSCVVLNLDPPAATALDFLDKLGPDLDGLTLFGYAGGGAEEVLDDRPESVEVFGSLDQLRQRIAGLVTDAAESTTMSTTVDTEVVPAAGHDRLRGRTVLVVDDDTRNVFAITGILELHGMRVLHAPDGRKGVEAVLANGDIDLVLMDVMMPEMDGNAATTAIREIPKYAELPIIAVTAKAMAGDQAKSLASGASDYVTKPVEAEDLLARMERLLFEE